jgi:hypothetical protein
MLRITSEAQLLQTFREIDRDEVQLPSTLKFPLAVKNFTSWIEPSGHRVYLVFERESQGEAVGVVFQRTRGNSEAAPAMCQWCNAVRGGSGVSLLTASVDKNHRIGIHLCSDLKCGEHENGTPSVHDLRESLSKTEKLLRLVGRMNEFAKKNLF